MNRALTSLVLGTALGCGLVAGVFFAFSTFVMGALARLPPAQGVVAMQSINVVVLNRWFLGPFLATGAVCALLAMRSLTRWSEPGAAFVLAGSALYLVGTILVTVAYHVPQNERLATLRPDSAEAAIAWLRYVPAWTMWNHVRGAAALLAAASLTIALLVRARAAADHREAVLTSSAGSRSLPAWPQYPCSSSSSSWTSSSGPASRAPSRT